MSISISQKEKHPDDLSPTERMLETAEILATAIIRQKQSREERVFGLDIPPKQSVHVPNKNEREPLS